MITIWLSQWSIVSWGWGQTFWGKEKWWFEEKAACLTLLHGLIDWSYVCILCLMSSKYFSLLVVGFAPKTISVGLNPLCCHFVFGFTSLWNPLYPWSLTNVQSTDWLTTWVILYHLNTESGCDVFVWKIWKMLHNFSLTFTGCRWKHKKKCRLFHFFLFIVSNLSRIINLIYFCFQATHRCLCSKYASLDPPGADSQEIPLYVELMHILSWWRSSRWLSLYFDQVSSWCGSDWNWIIMSHLHHHPPYLLYHHPQ